MRIFSINAIIRLFEYTKIYTDDFPTVTEYLKRNLHFKRICLFIHGMKTHIHSNINTKIDRLLIEEVKIKKRIKDDKKRY